ncbi:MAG: VWA domain-containing protein [Erythrobacter sp.]|uniref:vWA domain-containing protein n=1 Tax=Erythrobacter sp. TaxID=1042 RepID=UPI0025EFD1B0|nr:vWA domain-containing protein [Erythrobacter sp.]MCL9999552.1 VWA domain-containing protein [Erythrobacter sp.]
MHNLLHDKTANTLAIAAASLIPMMAMVGGGIDASRYYMAAARMQAACDAGALAARRAMPTTVMTTEARTQGLNFFDQNFNDGLFGVTNRTRAYSANAQGKVTGTASGTLPSTIMAAFGYNNFPISVTCTAEVNISNSDIMFVLDVTGSMADCPATSGCNSGPGSKIVGMRAAVMSFYDTVESATSTSAQVRYGLVPYSQQVNVGFSIPRTHMVSNHTYQSRVARFNPAAYPGLNAGDPILLSDQTEWLPRTTSNFGNTNTNNYRFRTDGSAGTTARNVCTNYPNTYSVSIGGVTQTWQVFAATEFVNNQWSGGDSNERAGCRARVRKTRPATTTEVTPQFADWVYCPVTTGTANPCGVTNPAGSRPGWETVNFSSLYTGNAINMPIGSQGAMTSVSWAGCIEEPSTVLTDTYSPIPANAHDLNINLVPANETQRWKPALINAVWKREDSNGNTLNWLYQTADESRPGWTCPTPARKLADMTRTDLQSYIDGLTANGNTYHDIGMLWGARFISPRGLFATENNSAPNGEPISRHIVFMTDGAQVNNVENYSTHGIEWWDRRVTGDGNSTRERDRRAARLQAICRAAQQENITVWVVAFGTTLTQNLIDCASPGRAFQAADNATLTEQFRQIAQKIAALRLTE